MINVYEFSKLKYDNLPFLVKTGELYEFQQFLQDNWNQRTILYDDNNLQGKQQFIDFDKDKAIKFKNYIGTIVFKGVQINIFPKVFKDDIYDYDTADLNYPELIQNLVYWLSYCDRINFPFSEIKNKLDSADSLLELLITIYVHYLQNAIRRQKYFCYEDIQEEGSLIKGKIDLKDYISNRMFCGYPHVFRYEYSSFILDNKLNRILKCTCRLLLGLTDQDSNRKIINQILTMLADVSLVECHPSDCENVHLSYYHRDYKLLLDMSKMFLLNKVNSFYQGNNHSFCFLFPSELLYEGFVGGFISRHIKDEYDVKLQSNENHLAELYVDDSLIGNVFQLREDIVIQHNDNIIILDTKYKLLDDFINIFKNWKLGIADEDIKQMAIYASKRNAKKLYLIYPLLKNEDIPQLKIEYLIHLGNGSNINDFPLQILKIPYCIKGTIDDSIEVLKNMLNNVLISI